MSLFDLLSADQYTSLTELSERVNGVDYIPPCECDETFWSPETPLRLTRL